MLRLLLGINMDLVASGATIRYHKTCFASYMSTSNLKSPALEDEAGQESAYDKSFLEMAPELFFFFFFYTPFFIYCVGNKLCLHFFLLLHTIPNITYSTDT